MLDILDGMAGHFKEKRDALLAWPWKLFCAQWARLIKHSHDERERQRREDEERAEREEARQLREAHEHRVGRR